MLANPACQNRWNALRRGIVPLALAALLSTACEFDPMEPGAAPGLACDLDLEIEHMFVDDEPYSPFVGDDIVYHDEPFSVVWVRCYHAGLGEGTGPSGDYTTLVEILHDDEIVWSQDFASESQPRTTCDYEEILVEDGLPAGEYVIRVFADPDGIVPECFDLEVALNNLKEMSLIVEAEPIDGLAEPGGESPSPAPGSAIPVN